MKRPTSRPILKVIALLAAGAAVNVAVAWGLAFFIVGPFNGLFSFSNIPFTMVVNANRAMSVSTDAHRWPTHWNVKTINAPGVTLTNVGMVSSPAVDIGVFDQSLPPGCMLVELLQIESKFESDGRQPWYFFDDQRGWPFRSMGCQWPWFRHDEWPRPAIRHGVQFSKPVSTQPWPYNIHELRALPLRPLWPGFAVNTLFYAAVLWVLFAVPGALRRMIRKRRGQCPACGYPVGTNEKCTECGAAVTACRTSLIR